MVFTDLLFIYIFLPLCMLCVFVAKTPSARTGTLTLFSAAALAWSEPKAFVAVIGSAAVNYLLGLGICRLREKRSGTVLTALGIVFNCGLLCLFRFSGAIHENAPLFPRLAAPLGLGFLTMRELSYLEACRSGRTEGQHSFMRGLLYASMFPTVFGGPLTPYAEQEKELERRSVTLSDYSEGMSRFIMGLGKKVIMAERLGRTAGELLTVGRGTAIGSWSGVIVTMLWYYFDLSGYCDMAIGVGRLFGFHIKESFRYPFAARTVRSFLGRFNGTVTEFFRTCVVKRRVFRGERRYIGVILAFLLAALWFRASVSLLLTMLFFGLVVCIEMLIGKKRMKALPKLVGHIYTKLMLFIGFTLLTSDKVGRAVELFKGLVGLGGAHDRMQVIGTLGHSAYLIAAALILSLPVYPRLKKRAMETAVTAYLFQAAAIIMDVLILMIASADIAGGSLSRSGPMYLLFS